MFHKCDIIWKAGRQTDKQEKSQFKKKHNSIDVF